MAEFDLPAAIDKVLLVTGAERVYYAGHSQVCFPLESENDYQFAGYNSALRETRSRSGLHVKSVKT